MYCSLLCKGVEFEPKDENQFVVTLREKWVNNRGVAKKRVLVGRRSLKLRQETVVVCVWGGGG